MALSEGERCRAYKRRQKGGSMAHYHCQIHKVKRGGGGGAVKKAAYNSGEKLHDNEQQKDFAFDKPEVLDSQILLPKNAPARFRDRATLWNEATKAEKDKEKGIIAREFEIAIPNALTEEQAKRLVNNFAKTLARQGMCVDYSIHWKRGNHHAHVLTTTRKLDKNGNFEKAKEKKILARDEHGNKIPLLDENGNQKVRVREGKGVEKLWQRVTVSADPFRNKNTYKMWRRRWQYFTNAALKTIGSKDRVSCKSYKERGIDKIAQIHEGRAAREIERRGGTSRLCEINREIKSVNDGSKQKNIDSLDKQAAQLRAEIAALEKEKKQQQQQQQQKQPEQKQNAPQEKFTICTIDGLSPQQRQAVARAVNPILNGLQRGYIARFPTFRAEFKFRENFVKNAVFAKTADGGVHILNINRGNAIKNGLLDSGGKAKDFTKSQLKDMSKNVKAVASAMFDLLNENTTSQQHLQKVKDNVLDIVKTPPQAVFDIIKNPVTGILSLPGKIFSMLSKAAEAGLNLMGAVAKGGSMGTGGRAPSSLGFGKLPVNWNTLSDEEKERIIAKQEEEELERMCGAYERDTTRIITPPPPVQSKFNVHLK